LAEGLGKPGTFDFRTMVILFAIEIFGTVRTVNRFR